MLCGCYRSKVAACAKHFVGDGGTVRGIDENNTVTDKNGLFGIHMPGYYNAVNKGVATVMVSYSALNGLRMHANKELVTGFLKNKLKFRVRHDTLDSRLCCSLVLKAILYVSFAGFCDLGLAGD